MFNDYYNRTEGHLEILRSELLGDEGVTGCEKRNTINLSVQLKLTRWFKKNMSDIFLKFSAYF